MSQLRNIRLTLAYDGTNYCGWQVQSNGPSIQAALERAIERLTGEKSAVLSAGRTDSGVHALGQVANFHTAFPMPPENFRPALQTKLPRDIVILDAREVPAEFHATFKAKWKRYRYLIDNTPVSLPFLQRYAWQLRRRLDAEAMHAAAQILVGEHDFRSFETDWPNKVTSVRTVMQVSVTRRGMWEMWSEENPETGHRRTRIADRRSAPESGSRVGGDASPAEPLHLPAFEPQSSGGSVSTDLPLICLEVTANGFLYNMVRSIVGTLVNVGRKKWSVSDVKTILEAQRRSVAGSTAPACGLYLVDVGYE
ncbi:MAG: tRNA pseudouridine(38-40) synthase TruA [Planctomycetaceae bacterium]|nr:tRNA pseudouridine(38-40) synthase TruA [Planctomycetaceae bacterium]